VSLVDQMTYEEFVRSIPNPTIMGVVMMDPLKGMAILEVELPLLHAFLDRLLGGECESLPMDRDPSEMVVLVTMEARFGEVEGRMNFCVPYMTIDHVEVGGRAELCCRHERINGRLSRSSLSELTSRQGPLMMLIGPARLSDVPSCSHPGAPQVLLGSVSRTSLRCPPLVSSR
jgi:flagellar motor switch protein FliM